MVDEQGKVGDYEINDQVSFIIGIILHVGFLGILTGAIQNIVAGSIKLRIINRGFYGFPAVNRRLMLA